MYYWALECYFCVWKWGLLVLAFVHLLVSENRQWRRTRSSWVYWPFSTCQDNKSTEDFVKKRHHFMRRSPKSWLYYVCFSLSNMSDYFISIFFFNFNNKKKTFILCCIVVCQINTLLPKVTGNQLFTGMSQGVLKYLVTFITWYFRRKKAWTTK